MKHFSSFLLVAGLLLAARALAGAAERPDDLSSQFRSPPEAAKPWVYWFWLDGNLTREGITADLEAMRRVGIGGVLIMEVDQGIPPGPARFGGPLWREMFKYMIAEAGRLGMEVDMNNDAGWNGSGGPWVTPQHAMQKVVWTETAVEGPRHFQGSLPKPEAVADYYRDIAVLAFPTPAKDSNPLGRFRIADIEAKNASIARQGWPAASFLFHPGVTAAAGDAPADQKIDRRKIVNLTALLDKDGRLAWDVPPGKWTLLRLGHTPTGAVNAPAPAVARGLECDKLSREAMDEHFNGLLGKLIADVGPAAGKTLSYTHIDSWEIHSQNWTPLMREEFRRRRGYDLLPLLPAMTGRVVDSLEISERFLWDLRRTIAELNDENYAGRLGELAHQHGMKLSIEAYGDGLFDDLSYAGRADSPMCEFWIGCGAMETVKEMASAGHTYGRNIIGAESFTSDTELARWMNHPSSIKALGDAAFCDGVNRFVFHRYAHQPWLNRVPGMTMGPWGIHYERTETWWEQTRPWHEYLARCNHLLRQGLYVADICYLQVQGSPSSMSYSPPTAYDFDVCSPEVVLTRMKSQDGRLVLPDGMSYRLLALPPSETMTPALLSKIKQLVEDGATVVGPRPQKSPSLGSYPDCDAQVQKLAAELWGDCDGKTITEHGCGRGRVVWGKTPETVLTAMGVPPDFRYPRSTQTVKLRHIHRAAGDTDIFFVANGNRQALDVECTFRVKGKRPEFWRPETGRIEPVAVYDEVEDGTRMPIWFDPAGSVFVVFRPDEGQAADRVTAIQRDGKPVLGVSRAAPEIVSQPVPEIVVGKALYGVPGDPARTRDVTGRVRRLVRQGEYVIRVNSLASEGDPAPHSLKSLTVDYAVGGHPCNTDGADPESIVLSGPSEPREVELRYGDDGRLWGETWKPGRYELKTASGKTAAIDVAPLPEPVDLPGPWELQFPAGWEAPEKVNFDKLISWSQHPDPGVKHFSGTATYRKTFQVPSAMTGENRGVYLDLGKVQVIAEVKLNGRDLGILWKPPFRLDITDVVRAGDNALEVRVTNLWVNRLVGDEQLPEDCKRYPAGNLVEWPQWLLEGKASPTGRHTFSTWRHWSKNTPLMESGLIGPVKLLAAQRFPCQF